MPAFFCSFFVGLVEVVGVKSTFSRIFGVFLRNGFGFHYIHLACLCFFITFSSNFACIAQICPPSTGRRLRLLCPAASSIIVGGFRPAFSARPCVRSVFFHRAPPDKCYWFSFQCELVEEVAGYVGVGTGKCPLEVLTRVCASITCNAWGAGGKQKQN